MPGSAHDRPRDRDRELVSARVREPLEPRDTPDRQEVDLVDAHAPSARHEAVTELVEHDTREDHHEPDEPADHTRPTLQRACIREQRDEQEERDVDAQLDARALTEAVRAAAGDVLQDVVVFDVYRGEGVDSRRKSVGLGLILQDASRTLTDEYADQKVRSVMQKLEREFGAKIRT